MIYSFVSMSSHPIKALTCNCSYQTYAEKPLHVTAPSSFNPSPADNMGGNLGSTAAFIEIESSFSLSGECKCVIYTCLVFYHDKAVHTLGKGKRETRAVASFIACPVSFTRLWFSIMLLSAAVKRPARIETNLSYSAFWFHSFSLSSLLLAYSFFTCDCQPVKVILNQSNPL